MNIYDIISQIEEEIGESKSGLFHKKVDVSKLAELVEQLKTTCLKQLKKLLMS